tara:strand:+ start:2675 stop:4327 length:1653 start_codon:yes stop_codon:yes gene_type:complete
MPIPQAADFYYLKNFQTVLDWVSGRYSDLLSTQEISFVEQFRTLPQSAQALLVRMVMRKGSHFRLSKLAYDEIGCTETAAQPLIDLGWLSTEHPLSTAELAKLLLKHELLGVLAESDSGSKLSKAALTEQLEQQQSLAMPWQQWPQIPADTLYSLTLGELFDRFRLLFFGNLAQSWSEFVLADLGVFRYEQVRFSAQSRGFHSRRDIDDYLHLRRCREAFADGASVADTLAQLGQFQSQNPWIEQRHQRLLFQLSQQLERDGALDEALLLYQQCRYTGARQRQIRILEKTQQYDAAYKLAVQADASPENEAERQLVERALRRLERKLKHASSKEKKDIATPEQRLQLPRQPDTGVEQAVAMHFAEHDAPVYYVENTLICSLFGLLCWDAVFAPLPGAFFHPFHSAPADLHSSDFYSRRRDLFDHCLARLESGEYLDCIRAVFQQKQGIQSPFVVWSMLSDELLEQALTCIPAAHLKHWFERLLGDIKANRAGMPDLIQFWPTERRYRMIEVKGPGDRLQDNQRRWLAFCAQHAMPVEVCYVQWSQEEREA